ncbi:MAG: amidohydrolase family protein [Planctomycetaceae bacterium]
MTVPRPTAITGQLTTRRRSFIAICATCFASLVVIALLLSHGAGSHAEDLPPDTNLPTGFRPSTVAIQGARIVTSPGQVIEQGTIVIRDGLIVAVGPEAAIPAGAEVIPGAGMVVYPGFIDGAAEAKLKPTTPSPDAGRPVPFDENLLAATQYDNRRGMTPELRVIDYAVRDAEFQSVRRKAGITDVQLVNFAPIAGGQTALVTMSGLPSRESVIWTDGMSSFMLSPPAGGGDSTHLYPVTLMGAMAHLRQAFLDTEHYRKHHALSEKFPAQISQPHEDPVLDALSDVLEKHTTPLFLVPTHAGRDDLDRAIDFKHEFNLDTVLWTGTEPVNAVDRLAAENLDVILSLDLGDAPKFSVKEMREKDKSPIKHDEPKVSTVDGLRVEVEPPQRYQDDRTNHWKQRAALPGRLAAANVRFAFSSKGLKQPGDWLDQVRLHIEHGLTEAQAVAALTVHAAEILCVDSQLGTIAVGKRGHLVALSGPLADKKSKVRYVLMDGLTYEYNKPKPKDDKDATPPAAQLTGQWNITIESGKEPTTAVFDLAQDGHRLTGTLQSEKGEGRIASGSIKGRDIAINVEIGAGGKVIELRFTGQVNEKTQLEGKVESAFGAPAVWKGERIVSESAKPHTEAATSDNPGEEGKPDAAKPQTEQGGTPSPEAAVKLSLDESTPDDKPEDEEKSEDKKTEPAAPSTQPPASNTPQPPESVDDKPEPNEPSGNDNASGMPPVDKQPAQDNGGSNGASKNQDSSSDKNDREKVAPSDPTELEADRNRRPELTGGNVIIRGGAIFTGTGEVLENASILVEAGKIKAIGRDIAAPEGVRVIDATGRFLTPGLIDTHSHIMIEGGVNEYTQSVVPEVRVKDTIRSNDVHEYRALAGGVTTIRLLHGSANTIGGQDAVVKLKVGQTAKEHLFDAGPQGVKFALGENVKRKDGRFPNTRLGVEAVLQRAFFEALDYRRRWLDYEREKQAKGDLAAVLPPRRDLRLEELVDIIEQRTLIHSHCYRADEILMLLRVAEGHGIRVQSLQHVLEGYKIAPEIAKHGASCSTFADWWSYKIEALDATPFNTSMLRDAGINTVVKSDDSELMRQLNLEAAKSLKYGNMPLQSALQMVTLNAARELGIHQRVGSLEVGKDGDIAIFNGHPMSAYSRVEMTLIEGEIRFQRDQQPTAMSPEAVKRTTTAPSLELDSPEVRSRTLALPTSGNGLYAITGAKIHPVDAPEISGGTVVVRDGKIEAIHPDIRFPEGATTIDATGLHLYPGLIDAGTTLGIAEIELVEVTMDASEIGRFQPDLRAGIAVNVESELVMAARAGGITTAFLRPHGGVIGGQYSVIQTAGWTPEEMVRDYTVGLALQWPDSEEGQQRLSRFVRESRLYDAARSAPESANSVLKDPRYEAMRPYVTGTKTIFVEAHSRKQIAGALIWAEEEKLKIAITGGTDAWKLAPQLKSRNVPVIVGPVMRSPINDWDPYDATYANPGRLSDAGVQFCIRSDNASNSRNAPLEAGRAVAFGLPEAEALKSVTLNAAAILGIDKECGSITVGKRADLILTDGSPLQTSTQIKGIFVGGKPFAPESRQTKLYEKYRARLTVKP